MIDLIDLNEKGSNVVRAIERFVITFYLFISLFSIDSRKQTEGFNFRISERVSLKSKITTFSKNI